MSHRFFVSSPIHSERLLLDGPEGHHLARVMRMKAGDEVVLFDGSGAEFAARVERVGRAEAELLVVERREASRELAAPLTLAVALPKGDRQKWLVEKLVELGTARLVPLQTVRGVAQPSAGAIERLRRGVIEASKQCERNVLMEVAEPLPLASFLAEEAAGLRLVAHPGGEPLARCRAEGAAEACAVVIGPEGGLSDEEVEVAIQCGWRMLGLGPRILRVETAAVAVAAAIALG